MVYETATKYPTTLKIDSERSVPLHLMHLFAFTDSHSHQNIWRGTGATEAEKLPCGDYRTTIHAVHRQLWYKHREARNSMQVDLVLLQVRQVLIVPQTQPHTGQGRSAVPTMVLFAASKAEQALQSEPMS